MGTRRSPSSYPRRLVLAPLIATALATAGLGLAGGKTPTVKVTEKEWGISPSPGKVSAGKVTFSVKNTGHLKHEFVVVKTNTRASKLALKGRIAVIKAIVAKIDQFSPGQTKTVTLTLKPGHYVLLCNLPAHYAAGQRVDFTVG